MSTDGKDGNLPPLPRPTVDQRDRDAFKAAQVTRFLESQRGKPQYRAAPPASRAVGKIIRPLSKKFGPGVSDIAVNWPRIVGERFAGISQPIKMQGGRDGRTLVIGAKGPAVTLIQAQSSQILERLNTLTDKPVARIKVQQSAVSSRTRKTARTPRPRLPGLAPDDARTLQSGLEHVEDSALKARLEKLGRAVLAKNKS